MTLNEFYIALSKTRRDWYLDPNNKIRLSADGPFIICPITSVHPGPIGSAAYVSAGLAIGLTEGMARTIAESADCTEPARNLTALTPSYFDANVRQKLLEACGLAASPNEKGDQQ